MVEKMGIHQILRILLCVLRKIFFIVFLNFSRCFVSSSGCDGRGPEAFDNEVDA
jgi:hypothetical protein